MSLFPSGGRRKEKEGRKGHCGFVCKVDSRVFSLHISFFNSQMGVCVVCVCGFVTDISEIISLIIFFDSFQEFSVSFLDELAL